MKVLLYFENAKAIKKSGIGRALEHQKKALELNGIEYTTNKNDSFDIAHVNTYFSKSYKLIKKCKKNNIPVIVHGHSTEEDFANSFSFWKLAKPFVFKSIKKTYSSPNMIITPTPYSKGLIDAYSYVTCPVEAISNGIDLNKYSNVTVTKEEELELRNKFNLGDRRIVLGIGWMFERKGFHDFIELAKSYPDVNFIWFGKKNKLMNTKVINKAIANKTDNVILPGYVPQMTIIKMLHISDCFLFPSYEETEGIVVLEALAAKLPLIVRNIGAFDYLTDMVNCLKGDDLNALKSKISYALNNDCTDITNNGFEIARARDLSIIGGKLKEQYSTYAKEKA